jgi:hypothetical protein
MIDPQRVRHHVTKYNITCNNFALNLILICVVINEIKSNIPFFVKFIPLLYIYINIDISAAVNHIKLL